MPELAFCPPHPFSFLFFFSTLAWPGVEPDPATNFLPYFAAAPLQILGQMRRQASLIPASTPPSSPPSEAARIPRDLTIVPAGHSEEMKWAPDEAGRAGSSKEQSMTRNGSRECLKIDQAPVLTSDWGTVTTAAARVRLILGWTSQTPAAPGPRGVRGVSRQRNPVFSRRGWLPRNAGYVLADVPTSPVVSTYQIGVSSPSKTSYLGTRYVRLIFLYILSIYKCSWPWP